ncbi:MAG: PD-(D/E)XK nuclease family protein [Acidilobus sp.]
MAWGSGFCTFASRLMSVLGARALGARKVTSGNLPGKGSSVHKLLSIASIEYLNEWKQGVTGSEVLQEVINESLSELGDLVQANDKEREEIVKKAQNMLLNLLRLLPEALRSLGIQPEDYGDLRFYAENEMIDYRLHIWGVPDLIIEHPRLKKAIIVEWKSDEKPPTEVEKHQAYIYAMLEAIRLGHGETFNDLIEAIAPSDVRNTKVLPIIIRPNNAYSDHPLFPIGTRESSSEELRKRIRERIEDIIVTAAFLTILLMDIDTLLYGLRSNAETTRKRYVTETTRERCVAACNGRTYYMFRYTPSLRHRGSPMYQYGYPCNICPFSDENSELQECRFYFGSFEKDKKDKLENLLWVYRFKVYRNRDRDMIAYRVLYELADRVNTLSDFERYLYSGKHAGFIVDLEKESIVPMSIRGGICGTIEVSFNNLGIIRKRVRVGVYNIDSSNSIYERLMLRRKLMPCEDLSGEIPRISLPRRAVLVTLIEDHVKYPTLGLSLFGRVEQTLLPGEKDEDSGIECSNDEVCVIITPISPYLRLPFKIFSHYINEYGLNKALVVEADADLTNIELRTLHSLHLTLKNIDEEEEEIKQRFLEGLTAEDRDFVLKSVWKGIKTVEEEIALAEAS